MGEFNEVIHLLFGENDELRCIIYVTLKMSFFSTVISSFIGFPLGVLLGSKEFYGKPLFRRLINTFMGIPPIVGGLIVYILLSRSGPFGEYRLLFSIQAMVIAQVLLITPIITGLTIPVIGEYAPRIRETAKGIGTSGTRQIFLMLYECRKPLISVVLSGFGRSIAEVGAVQLVGGNVQFKTRVMTTSIMLETNKGNFSFAIALGVVLLLISFLVNSITVCLQEEKNRTKKSFFHR